MSAGEDALKSALRPLEFAARRDFKNLEVVRDLERAVTRGLDGIALDLEEGMRARVAAVREALVGFDELPLPAKKQRLVEALAAAQAEEVPAALLRGAQPPLTRAASKRASSAVPLGEPRDAVLASGAEGSQGSSLAGPLGEPRDAVLASGAEGSQGSSLAGPLGEPRDAVLASSTDALGSEPLDLPGPRALFRAAPRIGLVRPSKRRPLSDLRAEHSLLDVLGIPPKTAGKLAQAGLQTVQDALFFLPVRYESRGRVCTIENLRAGEKARVQGVVAASGLRFAGRKRLWELALRDGTGVLSCRFFRFSSRDMQSRFPVGTRLSAQGTVVRFGAQLQMAHPELRALRDGQLDEAPELRPRYPEVEGVPPRTLERILQDLARAASDRVVDPVPPGVRQRQHLAPVGPALRAAHLPGLDGPHPLEVLRGRLAFDELFYLQVALTMLRAARDREPGLSHRLEGGWRPIAERILPFEPTVAQARVLDEITADLTEPRPMSRLLQGDVGSGKTAVAVTAAAVSIKSGRQAALLVPTEILAEQHLHSAQAALARLGLQVAILTGSTPAKARAALIRALRRQDVHLVVGTHALLEPDVVFADLGLAIVDEQHRFGVDQRARLLEKRGDVPPDVLVMTATPIPRTLTLSLYGDLRVSVLDERPPGRQPVLTRVYAADEAEAAYRRVAAALEDGRQAYLVYPLVETSDQLELKAAAEALLELRPRFRPHRVELLHGRMKSEQKSSVMKGFARGEVAVLVATTVIEVGVDVPNATVMLVEHAERFGLSQLHQLRGRVGRGRHQGQCLLVAGEDGAEARARLSAMAETSDGFVIAERDLAIRGPGEVLGTRQSGLPELHVASLQRDGRRLEAARREAEAVLSEDPSLERPEHRILRLEVERRFAGTIGRLSAG